MGNPKLMSHQVENIPVPIPVRIIRKNPLPSSLKSCEFWTNSAPLLQRLLQSLACEKQYNHYRDLLLSFEEGEVEWKMLGDLGENLDSKRKPITSGLREAGSIPYYGASGIVDYVKDYIFDGDFY